MSADDGGPASPGRFAPVPGEVYRDPVYDGASDPTVVTAPGGTQWMFYTQRRARHPDPGTGVAWVHGSRVGVAQREDGGPWRYAGTLAPDGDGLALHPGAPPPVVECTAWAPDVIFDGERWRMYLTEIEGVPEGWDGHARRIVEYVSDDLAGWTRRGAVQLASDRVIDAAVTRCPDGRWRIWFKDEAAGSTTGVASSADLDSWTLEGTAVGGRPHEGPFAFPLGGWWWLIVDEWRGMGVYRSSDAITWTRQGGPDAVILGESRGAGVEIGRHGSVELSTDGAAALWYFTHPWWDGAEISESRDAASRISAICRASLTVAGGRLHCAR